MFNTSIALTPSSGVATTSGTARTFDLISIEDKKSLRANAAAAIGAPQILTISHEESGSGLSVADRHLVRVDQTFPAAGAIPEQKASAYLVVVAPRNTVTVSNLNDLCGLLLHQCNTVANLAKIFNSEP
jgi:hypothetical protein